MSVPVEIDYHSGGEWIIYFEHEKSGKRTRLGSGGRLSKSEAIETAAIRYSKEIGVLMAGYVAPFDPEDYLIAEWENTNYQPR